LTLQPSYLGNALLTILNHTTHQKIHQTIAAQYPLWRLEGSYLQWNDIGQLEEAVAPAPIYHDDKLKRTGRFDLNCITWWMLKERGITIIGNEPPDLDFTVSWELLIAKMQENLNSYWGQFTRNPQRITWLLSDFGIEWTVLGVLRQYYTWMEQDITSKIGAAEYALAHLPPKWHRLIQEAIHLREQSHPSLYQSKLVRAGEVYNFYAT
jgi:hypothetical protein